jgi:hypothetical protein
LPISPAEEERKKERKKKKHVKVTTILEAE